MRENHSSLFPALEAYLAIPEEYNKSIYKLSNANSMKNTSIVAVRYLSRTPNVYRVC